MPPLIAGPSRREEEYSEASPCSRRRSYVSLHDANLNSLIIIGGHYAVRVKVLNIHKGTAEVEYLTTGWRSEKIGERGKVELVRLKKIFASIIKSLPPSPHIIDYVKNLVETRIVSEELVNEMLPSWYSQ